MYKNHLITLLALSACLLVNFGCSKKNQPEPTIEVSNMVKAIYRGDGDAYYTLSYHNVNQLTGFSFKASLNQPDETYSYSGEKLTTIITDKQKSTISYNPSGQVTKIETRDASNNHLQSSREYSYNQNGKVSSIDRYQTSGPGFETPVLVMTYTYAYDAYGLITTVTDRDRLTNTDIGRWNIDSYTPAIYFHPMVMDKIIFGDDFDFVVISTMTKLPLSISYQKINGTPPYLSVDTYQYSTTSSNITSIKINSTVIENGPEKRYDYAPLVFKY
ncbi:hypothetical protein AAFN85_22305 [Mucilaginibacter sp. CAU 1740]|uniref:hypothetical protein n=1 Tax=Mucilaginibacter sp. CAU 1740 TaxID=3140365 RepID=UPI00325BB271